MRWDRVAVLIVGVVLLWLIAKFDGGRRTPAANREVARHTAEPRLCNFWKREASPSERLLMGQALVEQYLNPYDYVPGCVAHPKNADRIASRIDVFCDGAGQSDRIVLGGVEDLAKELCGRR